MEPKNSNNKNLIVAFSLSLMVLLGWQTFFAPEPQKPNEQVNGQTNGQVNGQAINESNQNTVNNQQPVATPNNNVNSNVSINNNVNDAQILQNQTPSNLVVSRQEALTRHQRISINTARVIGSINLEGGRIDDLTLIDYKETLDDDSDNVHFLNPRNSENPYYADFGWLGDDNFTTPDQKAIWRSNQSSLSANVPVTLYWISPENIRFEKIFTIDENFMINVTQRVINNSNIPLTIRSYGLVARVGEPETLNFYILHEGFIGVLNEELIEEDYDDTEDGALTYNQHHGWFGITDKYWLTALIPQDETFNASFKRGGNDELPTYQADFYSDNIIVGVGERSDYQTLLFAGAKEVKLLDGYAEKYQIDRFDLAVDFGIMYFITKPIFQVIKKFSDIFGNFGLAILALTVVIKIIFYPLANKSYVSISRMKQLQPEIQELRERYGEDKQQLQQEMLKMYREKKVNPMAGCVPLLLQIPVFFALYKVLFVTIEMRHAPFFGWIQDLSAPDPAGILTFFGFIPWEVPAILAIVNIGVWPILMGLSMWVQQKLNPAPPDPIQQKIFAMLPFLFTFLLANFPAGLVIYWTCNNTLTIAQQWNITRSLEKKKRAAAGG